MKEWLTSYGYLIVVFIAAAIIFLVLLNKAAKAYSGHMKSYRAEEAEIKRLTALKEKYKNLDEETINNAPEDEILEGVALIYQLYLQKKEKIEEEFLLLNRPQQYIYVLDVFVSDASVKTFFSENSDILRNRIVPAMKIIGMETESAKIEKIRRMYDNYDEEISFSEKEISDTEKFLEEGDILRKIKLESAKYIKENVTLIKINK